MSDYAFLVKPNAILFYAAESDEQIGYTKWKNGIGPLGIKLPQGYLELDISTLKIASLLWEWLSMYILLRFYRNFNLKIDIFSKVQ